ncbi:hypothetical protein [Streptomyces sp. NPDC057740]|uniref:hypothetical protein n=1 Tax=Streptomyces sp. NPDC057740 TaxID=3346234 RepID=UPI00369DB982
MWRRIKAVDWIKWATVAATLVAGFGLIATAISTYYGALVAKLQLEQSRQDSEKEVADQASRFAFWKEGDGVVMANRSLYPADVIRVFASNMWTDSNGNLAHTYMDLFTGTIPPCTSMTFKPSGVRWNEGKRLPETSSFFPEVLVIDDHLGVT